MEGTRKPKGLVGDDLWGHAPEMDFGFGLKNRSFEILGKSPCILTFFFLKQQQLK